MNDEKPFPAIARSIKDGDIDKLQALLKEHPEFIDFDVPAFSTWLHYAASHGDIKTIEFFLKKGIDKNFPAKCNGDRPINYAASSGILENVKYLLGRGVDLDASQTLANPLFSGIVGRSPEICQLLLDAGIDTSPRYSLTDAVNETLDAVAFAVLQGEVEIAHMIAIKNSHGDEEKAQAAIAEGERIAKAITD